MRRRRPPGSPPPPELVAYDPAVWEPRVDPSEYDPNRYRDYADHRPVGEPRWSFEQWHRSTAESLWLRARMAWAREHGWPDGKTGLDLLREVVQQRRTSNPAPEARRATPRTPTNCWRPGGSDMRLVLTDADGPLLRGGQSLPGAIHDQLTQLRQAGLVERRARTLLADAGSPGLSAPTAGAVLPRPAWRQNQLPVLPALAAAHEAERRAHAPEAPASQRIRVEQGISHRTTWRARRGTSAAASTWPPSCARSPDWSVAGVRRVRLHSDGHRQDHPNAFERLPPDWVGWTDPVTVKTVRSRPELTRWCRARGSTVTKVRRPRPEACAGPAAPCSRREDDPVTDPAEFERRTEQLRLDRARRKVPGMYQQAAARTQRLLGHPPDRATPTCGHPGDPQFVDYLRGEDLRVVCLRCLLDRLAQPGHRSFDPRLHTCWSCGDDELVAEISAVVHVEGWDCVEHLLTAPLGFSCPACDGFEGKLPPIVIKRWGPDAAPRWAPAGDGPEPDAARCRRRGGLSCQLPKIMSTRWAELPADLQG